MYKLAVILPITVQTLFSMRLYTVLPITCIISGFPPTHPCTNGHVLLSCPSSPGSIRPAMLYQHTPSRDKLYTVSHVSFISGFSPTHTCSNGHVSLLSPTGSGSIRPAMLYQHTPRRLQTKTTDFLQTLHILDDI